jgi:integrase
MRSPGFEPGSSAWEADVLAKLDYDRPRQSTFSNPLKTIPTKTEETVINTLIALRNNGLNEQTVKNVSYKLRQIARQSNLNNPEEVKGFISTATNQRTKKPLSNASKQKFVIAYDNYCKVNEIQWKKPIYKIEETVPLIPTTDNINAIISNASRTYTAIFTILAEIGCSPLELHKVSQKDIDLEKGEISIRGVKGHASGTYKLKPRTAELLRVYIHKHPKEYPFPNPHAQSQIWVDTRRRASQKLCKPELEKICLRNLRNYSGAEFYKKLPIPDPIRVMRHLRHKKLDTTMHYLRAINLDYEEDDQWVSRTATTIEEDAKLIESGFQYVTERDGTKLYRKRK